MKVVSVFIMVVMIGVSFILYTERYLSFDTVYKVLVAFSIFCLYQINKEGYHV